MTESSRYYTEIHEAISRLERKVDSLRGEVDYMTRSLERALDKLIEKAGEINANISVTRRDISARLLATKLVLTYIDYTAAKSRLLAMKNVQKKLMRRMQEATNIFKEKFGEIMRDYLDSIRDFYIQFTRRVKNDLFLLEWVKNNEFYVEDMYRTLDPQYVDPELLDIVINKDIVMRIKSLKNITKNLEKAADVLEEASNVSSNFQKLLQKYEIAATVPEVQYILLPVVRVEVEFGGRKKSKVFGPTNSWEKMPTFTEKMIRYVDQKILDFPSEVTREKQEAVKELLLSLARNDEEKMLIKNMKIRGD